MHERAGDPGPGPGVTASTIRGFAHRRARRTARGNRLGLALVGFAVLFCGASGLVLGWTAREGNAVAGRLADRGAAVADRALAWPWATHAVALAGVAVTLLALRWLLVQARRDRLRWLRPGGDPAAGRAAVAAGAVGTALVDRIRRDPRVVRGRARFTECARQPRLWLDLELTEDADPADVWRTVREDGLIPLRASLELERLPSVLRVTVSGRRSDRRLA